MWDRGSGLTAHKDLSPKITSRALNTQYIPTALPAYDKCSTRKVIKVEIYKIQDSEESEISAVTVGN